MKVILGAVLIFVCLAVVFGLPAPSPARTINDEVEFIPLERQAYGDQPIIDTGVIGYDSPFSNPFGGIFENLENVMTRIRQQMETLMKRFPLNRSNSTEEIPAFPIGGGVPSFNFGDIDLGKGNTTSVTKIIDGHKVVINETEYKKEDDFGGAFFKVRIIDVKPDSTESTTNRDVEEVPTTISPTQDRESVENSVENEISKSREASIYDNMETFDEVDNFQPFQKFSEPARNTEWNNVMPVEFFGDNNYLYPIDRPQPGIDLSGDTRVNDIMADQGAPTNPDAEFIYDFRQPRVRLSEKFINPR